MLGRVESVRKVSLEAISISGRKSEAGDKKKDLWGERNKMLKTGTAEEDKVQRF